MVQWLLNQVDLQGQQHQTAGITIFKMCDGKIAESGQYDNHYDVLLDSGQIQLTTPTANAAA